MQAKQSSFDKLDAFYSSQIQPYQSILEAIGLQNGYLHDLQAKHQQLTSQYKDLKQQNASKKVQAETVASRQRQLKRQRNVFLEEALSVKQKQYEEQLRAKRHQVLQEIELKYQQICMIRQGRENKTNIFMHLDDQIFTSARPKKQEEAN